MNTAMKHISLLLISFVLLACDAQVPRSGDVIPVYWVDARDNIPAEEIGSFDRIEESCLFWGLLCDDADELEGSIIIILTDYGGPASDDTDKLGYAFYDPCEAIIWSADDHIALEHELGHTFKLEHSDVHENVMFPTLQYAGYDTTLNQRITVETEAANRCL